MNRLHFSPRSLPSGAVILLVVGVVTGGVACSKHEPSSSPARDAVKPAASSSVAAAPSGSAATAPSVSAASAAGPGAPSAAPLASASGAPDAADAGAAPPPRSLQGKTVLHCGDSMVGGPAALSKALEGKFKAEGAKFVRDWQVSASIVTYDHESRLRDLLQRHRPDVVVLTLGANDVFVPFPASMAKNVEGIVKKIAPRECYWIGPPTWKPDTGIVAVIRDHAAPCKFFDSSNMKLQRAGDGIHPTDKGGAEWGDKFWEAFTSGNFARGPELLDAGR